jgi:FAD synthetase
MSTEQLAAKYIDSAEHVFREIQVAKNEIHVEQSKIKEVIDWAKDYLADANYYREKKKFEVSLTAIAYCEGLLDALRLLGAVSFEWPSGTKRKRKAK